MNRGCHATLPMRIMNKDMVPLIALAYMAILQATYAFRLGLIAL